MRKIPGPFKWLSELENRTYIDSIEDDFILLEKPIIPSSLDYPFMNDHAVGIICTNGTMKGAINMESYTVQSPCLLILLPEQILQFEYISEDFSGLFLVMSKRFADSMHIQERVPMFISISNNPITSLSEDELNAVVFFYSMLQRAVRMKYNPYRVEIVQCLIKAFFYSTTYPKVSEEQKKTKNEIFVEKYLRLVRIHYKEQRGLEFYADKLCLTPKYLSKVIKRSSGISANDWINNHVVLEAKALLKSTNMTVQQISDELNFSTQSFFGKYFKRYVGMSPKEYKRG